MTHPNARKTHCLRGHSFSTRNTYLTPRGARVCRTCHRERLHGLTSDRHLDRVELDPKAVARLVDAFLDGVSRPALAGRFGIPIVDVSRYLRQIKTQPEAAL